MHKQNFLLLERFRWQEHFLWQDQLLWRGSLLPLECEALALELAPNTLRSASQPSGSKLPRHNNRICHTERPRHTAVAQEFAHA